MELCAGSVTFDHKILHVHSQDTLMGVLSVQYVTVQMLAQNLFDLASSY